jgi:hypothetical protein
MSEQTKPIVHDVTTRMCAAAQQVIPVGEGIEIVADNEGQWHFKHRCKIWVDETDGQIHALVCAPYFDDAHVVENQSPLTVSPSLLCSDCGTHGYVCHGQWSPC